MPGLNAMPSYKDFPKYDARRYMVVLFALELLQEGATVYRVAQTINCTRAEAQRAIEMVQVQLGVAIEKDGPVYKILSWGALNRDAALSLINLGDDVKNV